MSGANTSPVHPLPPPSSSPLFFPFSLAAGNSVVLLPIGASDDSAHSTNEKLNVENYVRGAQVLASYLEELAAVSKA